jgi:hypothetical protein
MAIQVFEKKLDEINYRIKRIILSSKHAIIKR